MARLSIAFALALAAAPGLGPGETAAETQPPPPALLLEREPPFNHNKTHLADHDFELLNRNGYRFQADGTVFPPGSKTPVGRSEIHLILEELISRQRLQAMLELDVVFNKYGTRNLPEEALTELRRIGRQNWGVLRERIRNDLKPYFSVYELTAMNGGVRPVRVPQSWLPTLDMPPALETQAKIQLPPLPEVPKPAALPEEAPKEAASAAPIASPTPSPAQPPGPATATPYLRPAEAAVRALEAAEQARLLEAAKALATAPPPGQPSPSYVASTPAAPPRIEAVAVSTAAPAQEPAAPPAQAGSGASLPEQAAPIPSIPEQVRASAAYPEMTLEALEQFLQGAPYGHEPKTLLRLIARHSEPEDRKIALGTLAQSLPAVVIDSRQAGGHARARVRKLHDDPQRPGQHLIVLNPGPPLRAKGGLFFGSRDYLLPDSTEYYRDLGLPIPPVQAALADAGSQGEVAGDWGKMRAYPDGSRRLRFPPEELAGTLLQELIRLDALRGDSGADPYHVELLSRLARFRFYRKLQQDTGAEPSLGPDLRSEFNEWRERPIDDLDFALQGVLASGAPPAASDDSAGRALDIFEEAGLLPSGSLRKASRRKRAPSGSGLAREDMTSLAESRAAAAWLKQEQALRSQWDAR